MGVAFRLPAELFINSIQTLDSRETRIRTTATSTAAATQHGDGDQHPDCGDQHAGSSGGACATPAECATGFCVDAVCCNSACTSGRCDLSGQRGTCSGLTPAPALAPRALALVAALLIGVGVFTLRRRAVRR